MGLPISELAYGADSLSVNYTIIIGHAPLCYLVGIAFIEVANANNKKKTFLVSLKSAFKAIVLNNLAIGIFLGISFNLLKFEFPTHTEDLLKRGTAWIIPISLFTMGGVLYYYRIAKSFKIPFTIIFTSLFIQPAVVYLMVVYSWNIEIELLRNAIVMAAMAPGLNAYFFANIYGECRDAVASTILVSTGLTIFTSSIFFFEISNALINAAVVIIAVPCWSS